MIFVVRQFPETCYQSGLFCVMNTNKYCSAVLMDLFNNIVHETIIPEFIFIKPHKIRVVNAILKRHYGKIRSVVIDQFLHFIPDIVSVNLK